MSKRAWMPLYVGDYLGDTGHLSTTQHGAYLLLMMHYWRKGELPDDDKQLAAICKLPPRIWMDTRETLQAFFYDGWRHKRIDAELAEMGKMSNKRALAGQKGGLQAALNRMNLENLAAGKSKQSYSKTKQVLGPSKDDNSSKCYDFATAEYDHSHSQRKKEEEEEPEPASVSLATAHLEGALRETPIAEQDAKEERKGPSQASRAELEAIFAKRRLGAANETSH